MQHIALAAQKIDKENLIVQWFSAYCAQYEMIDIPLLPHQGLHLADILKKLSQLWMPTCSRASTERPSNQAVLSLIGTATCAGPRVRIQISKIVPRLPRNICNRLRRSAVTSSISDKSTNKSRSCGLSVQLFYHISIVFIISYWLRITVIVWLVIYRFRERL